MEDVLPPDFYARDTVSVAQDLLGCVLETEVAGCPVSGRIVEVEAYTGPDDPAAHGYRERRSTRNRSMFGPPGIAYVYFIYGMHWCFNAVTEREGFPSAVLIRALEPLTGTELMASRRGTEDARLWCSGPARLCQALGIDREMDGRWLQGDRVRIRGGTRTAGVERGPRIGISRATDWPLRFWVADSPWISKKTGTRKGSRRTRSRT